MVNNGVQQGPAAAPKKSRIKEPSTHAGIAATVASYIPMLPGPWQPWAAGVATLFGLAAVIKRESK